MTAEVISIPGRLNYLSFGSGLGKSDTTVIFEPGGTIKQISSKQEGVTDDIVKLIGAAKGAGMFGMAEASSTQGATCTGSVVVYPIVIDAGTQMPRIDETNPVMRLMAASGQ